MSTISTYVANGAQQNFTFTFDYLSKAFVRVYLNGVETTAFTLPTAYTVRTNTPPAIGTVVIVRRFTSPSKLVDFVDGSILTSSDLNLSYLQAIHIAEEGRDSSYEALTLDVDGTYTARGRRISHLADPVNDFDAVTKIWATTSVNSSVVAAAASATEAANQAAAAAGSALVTLVGFSGIPMYNDRASFMAVTIPAPIIVVCINGLFFRRDAAGTAITDAAGAKWSPQGAITPLHWGDNTVQGVTDMTTALRGALAYACSISAVRTSGVTGRGPAVVDLQGQQYAISGQLFTNAGIAIQNGALLALSGFSDYCMLDIFPGSEQLIVRDVQFDGGLAPDGLTRYANLIRVNSHRVRLENLTGIHFPNFGIYVLDSQEIVVNYCVMKEWLWTEAGRLDTSLRTGIAFYVADADGIYSNCVGATSLYPLHISGALNIFNGCHFYNGGGTPGVVSDCVYITDLAPNSTFSGCYFDNGTFRITRTGTSKLPVTITGCHFQRNVDGTNTFQISYVSNQVGELVEGLSVVGCKFNGGIPIMEFSGSGTYAPEERREFFWSGNVKTDGSMALYFHKNGSGSTQFVDRLHLGTYGDYYYLETSGSLRINADSLLSGTYNKNVISHYYAGVQVHRFEPNYVSWGKGSVTGGGPAFSFHMFNDNFSIQPHDGAGGTSSANALVWDASLQHWRMGAKLYSPHGSFGILKTYRSVPTTSFEPGEQGEIAVGSGFIYCCVATDHWQRAALSDF